MTLVIGQATLTEYKVREYVVMQNNKLASIISIGIGCIVWLCIKYKTNYSDPQGTDLYWYVGYPIFLLSSIGLGYYYSANAWLWPTLMIMSQLAIGFIFIKSDLNLLPIGIMVYITISVPCIVAGYLGVLLKNVNRRFKSKDKP